MTKEVFKGRVLITVLREIERRHGWKAVILSLRHPSPGEIEVEVACEPESTGLNLKLFMALAETRRELSNSEPLSLPLPVASISSFIH